MAVMYQHSLQIHLRVGYIYLPAAIYKAARLNSFNEVTASSGNGFFSILTASDNTSSGRLEGKGEGLGRSITARGIVVSQLLLS
jgi:hypothetical protein